MGDNYFGTDWNNSSIMGAHPSHSRGNYITDKKFIEKYFDLASAAVKNGIPSRI